MLANWQHILEHNFAFIKPEMLPKLVELSEAIYEAESTIADLRLNEMALDSVIKQQETLDFVTTTPTTSAEAVKLIEKHGVNFPDQLAEKYPEAIEQLNRFAETNVQLNKQINETTCGQNSALSPQWKDAVHSIRKVVEKVAVKTIQTIVQISQHDDWEEARMHAESIGKLAEFEQHMSELIEEQNKYIAAGIEGPLIH